MKFNKLLIFLFALVSLNSCVEYVDNGTKTGGQETPEPQNFVAKQTNADTATKVKEIFEFEGKFNNVDVTSSTKFKVNGVDIKGNTYTPFKEGSHSVLATYLNFTSTFKFTVLPADEEEPEPTGNRIEYNSKANPVTKTFFILNGTQSGNNVSLPTLQMADGSPAMHWLIVSMDGADVQSSTNVYYTEIYTPLTGTSITYPWQAGAKIEPQAAQVIFGGANTFTVKQIGFTFSNTGNSATAPATANFTSIASGDNNAKAELFWNGNIQVGVQALQKTAKGKYNLNNIKLVNLSKIKVIK